jgi:hypothetical protein
VYNTKNTRKLVKLGTRQLDTFLLETQVSKGIGNMKETSETAENIRNVAELWKKLIQTFMMGSSRMRIFNAASDRRLDTDAIVRGAHLLPIYGQSKVPQRFNHFAALDSYKSFFVNHFMIESHWSHAHELILG